MPENIFEHTTSIAGLTCKPLSILSETISPQEMSRARGGDGLPKVKVPGDGQLDDGITSLDEIPGECGGNTYNCYPKSGHFDTAGKPFTQEFDGEPDFDGGLGPFGGGSGGGGSSESDTDSENHAGNFWDFDFLDECTVPYDCGDDDNDDDNNGSGLPDEENSTEGNNG